jgi:hypothetical protein
MAYTTLVSRMPVQQCNQILCCGKSDLTIQIPLLALTAKKAERRVNTGAYGGAGVWI